MRTHTFAPPLTAQVGSATYTYAPGRTVVVGRGHQSDIRLDKLDNKWVSRKHLVLTFDGHHWVAIDHSRYGTYVDGARVSTVTIHDGRAVNLGHPHEGPQLILWAGAPPAAPTPTPPPSRPVGPPQPDHHYPGHYPGQPTAGLPTQSALPRPQAAQAPTFHAPDGPERPPTAAPTVPGFPAQPESAVIPAPIESIGTEPSSAGPVNSRAIEPEHVNDQQHPTAPRAPEQHHEPAPSEAVEAVAAVAAVAPTPATERPPIEAGRSSAPAPTSEQLQSEAAEPEPEAPSADQPAMPSGSAPQQTQKKSVKRWLSRRRKSLTIGRSPATDITVDDVLVSRVHAKLAPTDAGLEITDKAGSNGTFVNGERVSRLVLDEGDIVTVGNADYIVSGTTLAPRTDAAGSALEAHGLGLSIDGEQVLTDVSFSARPGTLTAIIGPPGAGKSTLLKLLGGAARPSSGLVSCDGHDVHAEYGSMRSRIAMVPHDDVMHDRLTVEQVLGYAAELRLPSDTSRAERRQVVNRVVDELELAPHRMAKAGRLSAGERRRVTVATELLTGPSLVIFDEGNFEPDQSLGRQMMTIARRLADAGRTVVVAPHSLALLSLCDQVLLLTAKGRRAFAGPPAEIKSAIANTRWSQTFPPDNCDPGEDGDDFAATSRSAAESPAPLESPARRRISPWRQISVVARRQARLILADRGDFVFLAILPFVFGALSLAVPGTAGLGRADSHGTNLDQPLEMLVVLIAGAVFMGTALTIRELVAERPIFRRERSIGLSAPAYLAAKSIVFGLVATVQTAIMAAIPVIAKGAPAGGTVLPREPVAELFAALLATAIISAVVGFALSALAKHKRDVVPMFMLVVLISLVFCGGVFPLTDRFGAKEISWLIPSRWGFAASASTVDLQAIDPLAGQGKLWTHSPRWWAFDMGMLVISGAAWAGLLSLRPRVVGRKLRRGPEMVPAAADADRRSVSASPPSGQTMARETTHEATHEATHETTHEVSGSRGTSAGVRGNA